MSFTLAPNPAKNAVTLVLNEFIGTPSELTIFNWEGKMVYSKVMQNTPTYLAIDLNQGNFSAGVYAVVIRYNDQLSTQKLIVE